MVQDSADGADFIVQGNVRMVPIGGGQQRVEIQWTVKAANGDERGKVVQLNEIPAGSLDHYWADVAVVVASEAAGGVNDVILRQSGAIEAGQWQPGAGQPVNGQPANGQPRSRPAGSWTGSGCVGRRRSSRHRAKSPMNLSCRRAA